MDWPSGEKSAHSTPLIFSACGSGVASVVSTIHRLLSVLVLPRVYNNQRPSGDSEKTCASRSPVGGQGAFVAGDVAHDIGVVV